MFSIQYHPNKNKVVSIIQQSYTHAGVHAFSWGANVNHNMEVYLYMAIPATYSFQISHTGLDCMTQAWRWCWCCSRDMVAKQKLSHLFKDKAIPSCPLPSQYRRKATPFAHCHRAMKWGIAPAGWPQPWCWPVEWILELLQPQASLCINFATGGYPKPSQADLEGPNWA